jgi:hypothetical protein
MSAYEEYAKEKRAVDTLLQDDYLIAAVNEVLEGMEILFKKRPPESDEAQLLLLTADARKYVSNLIFSQQIKQA